MKIAVSPGARNWLLILMTMTAGAACGAVWQRAGWPLPWILGPLITAGVLSVAGLRLEVPSGVRRAGQLIIGANIGLGFSAPVLERVLGWAPLMVGVSLFMVALCALMSVPFSRFSRIDRKTAFFAMMPGGVAEMANIGTSVGAKAAPIAMVQVFRVGLVVCLIPPFVAVANLVPVVGTDPVFVTLDIIRSGIVIMSAFAGVFVVTLLRVNNPWLIGAVVGSATLVISGLIGGHLPAGLYNLGQILVGVSIGAQFKRNIIVSMLRIGLTAIGSITILSAVLVLLAWVIVVSTSIEHGTAILATSAGGMAEMSATAIALHLDVALVAAFHFIRVIIINGFALYFWRMNAWWINDRRPKV